MQEASLNGRFPFLSEARHSGNRRRGMFNGGSMRSEFFYVRAGVDDLCRNIHVYFDPGINGFPLFLIVGMPLFRIFSIKIKPETENIGFQFFLPLFNRGVDFFLHIFRKAFFHFL